MSDFSVALLGLPRSGKTVVFRLLTKRDLAVGPHPDPSSKSARGIVQVQDERMAHIAEIIRPPEIFPLEMELVDSPGISEGMAGDTATGHRESFNALREADVLAHILRGRSSDLEHSPVEMSVYLRDAHLIEAELIRSDTATVSREIQRMERLRQAREEDLALLKRVGELLAGGQALRTQSWDPSAQATFKQLNLITYRPQFYVVNYGEDEIARLGDSAEIVQYSQALWATVGSICGQIEYEMAQLSEEERREFQELYPQLQFAAPRFPWWAMKAMNMVTYFTFGRLGLKEWAVTSGATAFDAAKRLHTDIAKGLVATEVFSVDDLLRSGSLEDVKAQGRIRVEGRDHRIQDGDILYFRTAK